MGEMDYVSIVVTPENFWKARFPGRARWIMATARAMCAYQRLEGVCAAGPVLPAIDAGEMCFDTGDRVDALRLVALVLCGDCAHNEIPDAAFDLE